MIDSMTSGAGAMISALVLALQHNLWWVIPSALSALVIAFPMPGRGPISTQRDPWRGFGSRARAEVFARAGHRCEASTFVIGGRCPSDATQIDHVYAWSRGGPSVVSNGQALCASHNRSKSNALVPWWYLSALERRRRAYFPRNADVRVRAVLSEADRAARAAWAARRAARSRP